MIKTVTLASLLVLMLKQANAGAVFTTRNWDECVFQRPAVAPAGTPAGQEAITRVTGIPTRENHVKANAGNVNCVKNMEKGFFNRLGDHAHHVFEYLRDANNLKDVKEEVLKGLTPDACLEFRASEGVDRLTASQIKVLPNHCLSNGTIGLLSRAQVQAIDPKTEGTGAAGTPAVDFLTWGNFRRHMTPQQLKKAAGNEFERCDRLTPDTLAQINPSTLAKLESRCFIKAGWVAGAAVPLDTLRTIAHYVNPAAFNDLPAAPLPDELHGLLGSRHIKVLDDSNREDPCQRVKLDKLPTHLAGDVSKKCFKNAFGNALTTHANMARYFIFANDGTFGDIKESDELSNLDKVKSVWTTLSKKHYDDILKHSTEICEQITFDDTDKHFSYAADLSAECFAKMVENTQKWILKNYTMSLKDDILSKLDSEHGVHLEDAIKVIAATRPSLLKHFGAGDPGNNNVCSAYKIGKLKDPKELKRAGHYFPTNCLKTMIEADDDGELQYTELSLYPKNLVDLIDMEKLLANLSEDALSSMDETKWKAFVGAATCKGLKYEQFQKVDSAIAFKHINVACLDALTFLDSLEKTDIQHIPPTILAAAAPKTIGALNIEHLTEDQVKALGANTSGFGDDAFNKLSEGQVGALSAQGVAGLTVGAFKAIKEEVKWLAVKPDSLTLIRFEQLDAVPEAILLKTTEKQAEKIPADAARAFTAERRAKLTAPVQGSLKELPKTK